MSSEQRASSAVRNLRSMFENKSGLDSNTNSPVPRGRSPGADEEEIGGRPTSTVRASFVSVGPAVKMASTGEHASNGIQAEENVGPAGQAVEIANGTPPSKADDGPSLMPEESPLGHKSDSAPANPDKPVTAAEEEPGDMKPAEPTNEEAVSGGEALPPVAEDLRASAGATSNKSAVEKSSTNGKPPDINVKSASKSSSSTAKSPASQPKTPQSGTAPLAAKAVAKKASRSSLAAPTAASMARMGAASEKPAGSKTSPPAMPKKREATKPSNLPSHLTAPTASSRAKHEAASDPTESTTTSKTSASSRQKPATSTKSTPRSSLAPAHRPKSQTSHAPAPRRSLAAADGGSFLERMMKPTAASASKTHEKPDTKSPPPKAKASVPKSKPNGSISTTATTKPATQPVNTTTGPKSDETTKVNGVDHVAASAKAEADGPEREATPANTSADPATEIANEEAGNETPIPATNEKSAIDATLEATPVGLMGEETIR